MAPPAEGFQVSCSAGSGCSWCCGVRRVLPPATALLGTGCRCRLPDVSTLSTSVHQAELASEREGTETGTEASFPAAPQSSMSVLPLLSLCQGQSRKTFLPHVPEPGPQEEPLPRAGLAVSEVGCVSGPHRGPCLGVAGEGVAKPPERFTGSSCVGFARVLITQRCGQEAAGAGPGKAAAERRAQFPSARLLAPRELARSNSNPRGCRGPNLARGGG